MSYVLVPKYASLLAAVCRLFHSWKEPQTCSILSQIVSHQAPQGLVARPVLRVSSTTSYKVQGLVARPVLRVSSTTSYKVQGLVARPVLRVSSTTSYKVQGLVARLVTRYKG